MKKRVIALAGLALALGAPLVGYAAVKRVAAPGVEAKASHAGTITCPITGKEIPPCCCPLKK